MDIDSLYAALTETNPKKRYLVTSDKESAVKTIRRLLRKAARLNTGHSFEMNGRQLGRMLEKEPG